MPSTDCRYLESKVSAIVGHSYIRRQTHVKSRTLRQTHIKIKHCTLYNGHSTLCNDIVQCSLYTVQCTMYNVEYIACIHNIYNGKFNVPEYTRKNVNYIIQCTLYTVIINV